MSHRLLWTVCGGVGLLIAIVFTSPVAAEDTPAAPTAPASSGETYKLAYKFQPEEIVRYETVQNVKFVSQFSGNVETATNKTETRKAYRVKRVHPDGSADLELVIEWVRMKADFGGGGVPTEFDSTDPGAKSQVKFKDVMKNIGKPQAELTCSPSGEVLKVREMTVVTPGAVNATNVKVSNFTGRDEFNFLTVFPRDAVPIGHVWTEKSEALVTVDKLQEKIKMQRTYKLESVEGDMATVAFKTSILTPVKDPNIAIQMIQRETKGKLVFDMARGAVLTRTVDVDKSVINPVGANTAMHSTSHLLERIMTATVENTSDVPGTGTTKQ